MKSNAPIKVLVVDDSSLIRRLITRMLEAEKDIQVIGQAADGLEAITLIKKLCPQVVTMDVEMPRLDGIGALRRIMKECPVPVIMLSALTTEGARATMDALGEGALDFVPKPRNPDQIGPMLVELTTKIRVAAQVPLAKLKECCYKAPIQPPPPLVRPPKPPRVITKTPVIDKPSGAPPVTGKPVEPPGVSTPVTSKPVETPVSTGTSVGEPLATPPKVTEPLVAPPPITSKPVTERTMVTPVTTSSPVVHGAPVTPRTPKTPVRPPSPPPAKPVRLATPKKATAPVRTSAPAGMVEVVVIGCSTGGPVALQNIIPRLPADFPVGVVVVQHIPVGFSKSMAEHLNRRSAVEVIHGTNGDEIRPGRVIIAPAGCETHFVRTGGRVTIQLKKCGEPIPPATFRPSVDQVMLAATNVYGGKILGVLLTGMGRDGAQGMLEIRQLGGRTIAQDEASCVVFGMPKAAIDLGAAEKIVPLPKVAQEIMYLV